MPRKRTLSDEVLLDAALHIAHRRGPEALSFGALAAATGLAASTLVQRFGSRPEMVQATLQRAWDELDRHTAAADASAGDGPAGVVELLVALTGTYPADDAGDYADQLLMLREDLRDPVLRSRGAAWIAALVAAVERRLGGAPLGPIAVAHWQGLLTIWAFTRPAPLAEFIADGLDDLLAVLHRGSDPG